MKSKGGRDAEVKCECCGATFKTRGGQYLCGECALKQLMMPKMFARRMAAQEG